MYKSDVSTDGKIRLLFICLGNICRSPAAHGVMQQMVDEGGIADRFYIDSAGIGDWHVGQLPDLRMRRHGARRGYDFNHHARQFKKSDFGKFDYIVVMDESNYSAIMSMTDSEADRRKVIRMVDYISHFPDATSVPDPYYGESEAFDFALDLIEDGCRGIMDKCLDSLK